MKVALVPLSQCLPKAECVGEGVGVFKERFFRRDAIYGVRYVSNTVKLLRKAPLQRPDSQIALAFQRCKGRVRRGVGVRFPLCACPTKNLPLKRG